MSIQEYVDQMKSIQQNLLDFLDQMQDEEERFHNIIRSLVDLKKNQHKLKSLLYMIVNISNNHHRYPQFFDKIEKILQNLKSDIKNYYSNYEIFKIFKSNKRLLLFLIEENMIIVDENIENQIKKIDTYIIIQHKFYCKYLLPEQFLKNGSINDNFNEKRRIGENDTLICQLIRQDLISEFITYVKKNDFPLKSEIKRSIFETNSFLLSKERITLIEYAVFFGSVQIFKYLYKNGVDLNQRLWLFAIHGDDPEIFHIFEDEKLPFTNCCYLECIEECVKCHNISVLNYIQDNYNNYHVNFYDIHYYNFACFPERFDSISILNDACKYDNFEIVDYYMKTKKIDINQSFNGILKKKFFLFNEAPIKLAANKNNDEILDLLLRGSNSNEIKEETFKDCKLLLHIKLPCSITSIGRNAFEGCVSLFDIFIPSTVTTISPYAFYKCTSLTEIKLPDSVNKIGERAFCSCSSLCRIIIPSSVTLIESYTFAECKKLKEISIPSSVTSIGSFAFYNCFSLSKISIPSSVTSIGEGCFYECSSLKKIEIETNSISIGSCAFYGCKLLSKNSIPSLNKTSNIL